MGKPGVDDRLAIDDLFVRYVCALDEGDVDALVDCFAEDGSLASPVAGVHKGHAAIRAFAQRFARYRASGAQLRHVISNLRIDVDGDRARARCYLVVFLTRNGETRVIPPGQYDCDLVRTGGGWRFQHRVVAHDLPYTLEGL
ncbi:MAG: nuclear transport factor 2 family protein [Burkholderiales bacterium]